MIVSASYRTDIPAFYGRWFMQRLAAGAAHVRNPYGGAVHSVSLTPTDVDGIVFWTRNVRPFAPHLPEIRARYPFVVQFTITGYPRALDSGVVPAGQAVADARALAGTFGPRAVVWRYDPVVFTTATPASWHRANFAHLATRLSGAVDEVVVSFAHIYSKTRRNLDRASAVHGFSWSDPSPAEKRALLQELSAIAAGARMRLTACSQPDLSQGIAGSARCIDAERLSDIAGRPIAAREKGNRPGCLCHESRDIGAYDTCPHGCVYCYAVSDRGRAKRALAAHRPGEPRLGSAPIT